QPPRLEQDVDHPCPTELRRKPRYHAALIGFGALSGKHGLRRGDAREERDRHAVAGEGGYHGELVADREDRRRQRLAAKIAVRNRRDCDRLRPAWLGTIEKLGEKRRLPCKICGLGLPVGA